MASYMHDSIDVEAPKPKSISEVLVRLIQDQELNRRLIDNVRYSCILLCVRDTKLRAVEVSRKAVLAVLAVLLIRQCARLSKCKGEGRLTHQ
jgi:primosomal protein N''